MVLLLLLSSPSLLSSHRASAASEVPASLGDCGRGPIGTHTLARHHGRAIARSTANQPFTSGYPVRLPADHNQRHAAPTSTQAENKLSSSIVQNMYGRNRIGHEYLR